MHCLPQGSLPCAFWTCCCGVVPWALLWELLVCGRGAGPETALLCSLGAVRKAAPLPTAHILRLQKKWGEGWSVYVGAFEATGIWHPNKQVFWHGRRGILISELLFLMAVRISRELLSESWVSSSLICLFCQGIGVSVAGQAGPGGKCLWNAAHTSP